MKNIANLTLLTTGLIFSLHSWAQTCPEEIEIAKPIERYTIKEDNTVVDNQTGLIWMRCSLGQNLNSHECTGGALALSWQEALLEAKKANEIKFLGYSDWRLPSVAELRTLVESACFQPSINDAVFPNTLSSWYRTSSPFATNNSYSWNVNFNFGYENGHKKDFSFYVRLVRGNKKYEQINKL